jgi:putative transcriptional regulator
MGRKKDFDEILSQLTEALAEPEERQSPTPHHDPQPQGQVQVPDGIDVVAIRQKAGLSQAAFANRIGVPVGTLRNWEQGHRSPTGPARVLLALLDRNPRIVEETL